MPRFINQDAKSEIARQNRNILRQLIPAVWKQAFIAPMAIKGDYERIGIKSRILPGMEIRMWKNHMEVHYKEDIWSATWEVGRPWHITGGWTFSSNWRSADTIMPALICTLIEHSLQMTDVVRL